MSTVTRPEGRSPEARASASRRLRRVEATALGAVVFREYTVFVRYWWSSTFSSIVEPTIYLLAFGFGFGALVSRVGGLAYIEFIGTGIVGTAVLFTSAFPGMFATFVRRTFQRTYDAILAAPIDVEEIVTGEALWLGLRAGVYGCAPLLVATAFGLRPGPGVLLVPLIGFVTGLGFGLLGMWISGIVTSIDQFNYVISALLTPLFLVAGTFFPVDALGPWAVTAAQVNPLYHCVELVRSAVFGFDDATGWWHLTALVLFAFVMWRLAVRRLEARLID